MAMTPSNGRTGRNTAGPASAVRAGNQRSPPGPRAGDSQDSNAEGNEIVTGASHDATIANQLVTGLHCDSCGAGIAPDAQRCEYCGQVPVILVKGAKLSVLLTMYLEADRFQEAQDLSSEILKEHPQNALAWAAKGIATLRVGSAAPLGIRVVSASDVVSALKCFDNALEPGRTLSGNLRKRAATDCMLAIADWRERWRQAYFENSFRPLNDATKSAFAVLHFLARSVGRLNPDLAAKASAALADIDDSMERCYGCTWPGDGGRKKTRGRR